MTVATRARSAGRAPAGASAPSTGASAPSKGAGQAAPEFQGVLEPPRLIDGVVLHGTLEDTAFEQQQFLVERDGAFVQLTPLLYRALEQVDGKRSFAEIAKRVSEK